MDIKLIKKNILKIDEFQFKCSIGAKGIKKNKIEGDLCTPKGRYKLKNLFYRDDRGKKFNCVLNTIKIKKNMGWCDDPRSKYYNSLIKINKNLKYEKLFRRDHLYDFLIEINHNHKKKPFAGSAIFIHLTKNYKPTKGCIAINKKNMTLLISKINNYTKMIIN